MTKKKPRALRTDSVSLDVLRKMFFLHGCWKTDIHAYAKTKVTQQTASVNIDNIVKRGLITVENDPQYLHPVYKITSKGKNYVIDHSDGESFFANIVRETDYVPAYWKTDVLERNLRGLVLSKIQLLMCSAQNDNGISPAVFPNEKPSLMALNNYLSSKDHLAETGTDDIYASLSSREVRELMCVRGVFYTNSEVMDFWNKKWPDSTDKFNGSRFAGVFFSNNKCLIIYANKAGKGSRQLRVQLTAEEQLVNAVSNIIEYWEKDYIQDINDINALVITEGYSAIKTMVTGYTSGRDKKGMVEDIKAALQQKEQKPRDIISEIIGLKKKGSDEISRKTLFLQHDFPLFNKLYAVYAPSPSAYAQLSYLLHWSYGKQSKYRKRVTNDIKMKYEEDARKAKKEVQPVKCFCAPIIEVNSLCAFRREMYATNDGTLDTSKRVLISTQSDLAETVAVCISSPAEYYDLGIKKMDYAAVYSRYGFRLDKPDRYEHDFAALAKSEIDGTANKEKEKWPRCMVDLDPEHYDALRKICEARNCTISGFIRENLNPAIEQAASVLSAK